VPPRRSSAPGARRSRGGRRGAGPQAVHDEVEQPAGPRLPVATGVDAPEETQDEQHVVGVEAGPDAAGLLAGPQQQGDGADDRPVGLAGQAVAGDGVQCADEGIGTVVWSPLARGRLAREADEATTRAGSDPFADMLYTQESADRAIIDTVAGIAKARGVSRAQVALAWLRHNPVVVAPLVGATRPSHIDDAVASLDIELTDEEIAALEAPYTPRYDFQGISDDAELARISARIGIKPAGS
jgi:hypothetical protein